MLFKDVIAPISEDVFLGKYWMKQFVRIPGNHGRFSDLFDWKTLNETLERHRFVPNRLRLVKNGKEIAPVRFLLGYDPRSRVSTEPDVTTRGYSVDSIKLMQELANGATLVLSSCEEISPSLRQLCTLLERLLHIPAYANLFASWREDNGLDVHWDPQDTLILQASGRKHWTVWEPTMLHPLKGDGLDITSIRPVGDPVWDGVLSQGDLLNMPRGWWHVAYPLNEPSLHLTITVKSLTGIDFLSWFIDRLKANHSVRRGIPLNASQQERVEWLSQLWEALGSAWTADLIQNYIVHLDGDARPRPTVDFPFAPLQAEIEISAGTMLRLIAPRQLHFAPTADMMILKAMGQSWKISPDLAALLRKFDDGEPHCLSDQDAAAHDHQAVTLFRTLVRKGVFSIVRRGAS